MNCPLISVIIPVYNGSNYLKEAIDSALNQTYKNIEVIVVNDGSKDDGATEKIALSYGDKIRYFSKENGGVSSALNVGIQEMRGEYFSWLSHDDLYTETKIEKQVALITEENKNCIFECGSIFIDQFSRPLNRRSFGTKLEDGYYTYDQMLSHTLKGNVMGGCELLIPKVLFDEFGLFNVDVKYMQDLEMWYRFMLGGVGFVIHTSDLGVMSRVHNQQATVTSKHLFKKDGDIVGPMMIEKLLKLPSKDRYLLAEYMFSCCKTCNTKTAKEIYIILKKEKKLSLIMKLKYFVIRVYGVIRPLLVRVYYKLFLKTKIKSNN